MCTHNNNKTRFCKIMKANRMRFLPSQSLWTSARNFVYICKNISIKSEMSAFKWTNSNGKQIFSDYVICMKHAYRRIHYCDDDESVSPTSSLKPKTKKALVYQIIKMLMHSPYCFSLTHSQSLLLLVRCGKLYVCAWVLNRLCWQLKAHYMI